MNKKFVVAAAVVFGVAGLMLAHHVKAQDAAENTDAAMANEETMNAEDMMNAENAMVDENAMNSENAAGETGETMNAAQ